MSILELDQETLLKKKKIYLASYQKKIVKVSTLGNNEARIVGTLASDQEVSIKRPQPVRDFSIKKNGKIN